MRTILRTKQFKTNCGLLGRAPIRIYSDKKWNASDVNGLRTIADTPLTTCYKKKGVSEGLSGDFDGVFSACKRLWGSSV
jgi:hypothetical protein